MPRLLEADAEFLTLNYDTLAPDKQAEAKDWLQRYKQQQADEGEPLFPSVVTRQVEQENNLRRMFEAPDKIDYDPGYTSADPLHDKMQHANMAFLASRYQKEPAEVASRYDFLLNDYARQKLGASEDVDTAKFYALAQKDMQKVKLREDTQREGMSAALRGEDGVKALAAWQAKNADRAKDDAGLFMRGYQQALEQDGEMLPIADRLWKALESGTDKTGQNVQANMERGQVRQELGQMVEQLAGMKKAQRKSVYRSIAARIQAAGYDQKGLWSQMLGFLDQQLYRAETTLSETGGIASDVASNFPAMLAEGMTGNRDFGMTPSETAQTDASVARRKSIGNVQEEIMQIVSDELDPVKPTTGWMNETVETGLIKAPGAVVPFMAASALLGPYGAGLVFTADFAAQNRRELVQSGLDDEQAQKIAVMAAPLQAAVESLSNMVSLGKFPAVQAALPRFTRPVGGASLVGRYVQNSLISGATEFIEEQVQDNVVVPAMQELLGALEKDVPEVDWSFYKTRAANASPELAATLLPMALVFGGVMTAADAKLSRTMTQNADLMMATGMDQAQAVEIASQPTHEQRIKKGAELWLQRKGTKASMEEAQKKLADQYRTLAADSAAAVKELEARGVLPRLLPMQGGEYRLTFNDGSTADFKTREEALGGIHVYIRDRMQRSTRALRETIDTLTKNLEQGREFALEISPEAMPADEAVKRGIISPQALQERAAQGAILDATTLIENSVLTGKALGDEETPLMLFGMSKNEWYDKEGRAIGMQRIKDDILRTTMRLWDGASPLTLIEEKTEGDAKVILSTPGKRQWMLDHLRAYEDASGDKLFTSDDNEQINDKQLIEAWSHMAQSYFVAAKDKVKGRTLGRYLRDIEEAELTAAMQGRASWWQAVVNRAQKLGELKAAGKLGADVVAELEKQLGIDSQVKHEQEAMQEAQNVANEVAQQASDWVDDSQFDNLPPSNDTFSMASASGAAQTPEPSPGGLSEAEARNPITIYRAGDANEVGVRPWASFTTERSVAEAYTDNPGFGGDTVRELRIDAGNVLDLTSGNKFKKLAEALGFEGQEATDKADEWHSNGWNYPWEESSKVKRALEESEFDAVQYTDDFPSGATTIIFTRQPQQIVKPSFESSRAAGGTQETFAARRAIPADASKVVQMPDGARLVGPTTFSIRAFHGTPHKVDKFRMDKLLTGEGNNAYGSGLYFAENREVAKQYQDSLAHRGAIDLEHEGRKRGLALSSDTRIELIRQANTNKDDLSAARALQYANIEARAMDMNALAEIIAARRASVQGNLYTVELLPDADQFLDWDKPLSEQSEKVKTALAKTLQKVISKNKNEAARFGYDLNAPAFANRSDADWLIDDTQVSGAWAYGKLREEMESKEASRLLASLGIPGIRYLDQGSRGAGDGTRNFVIFDENLVRILEENGKPVAQETFSLRVTPAQDAEYMAAVEAGDMEKVQRMVDEAAKSAGYKSASVIHSTNAEFNSFGRVRWVSTIKGRSEVITPIKSTGIGLIYATQDSAYSALFGDKQLKLYHNISNPADLRSLGSRNVSDSAFDATLSTLGIAHKSSSMGAAPVFERLNKGQHKKAMLEAGFDGFALRERSGDLEADAIAGFDSSQFKSADPVTRDESGNVIPLSQRFNPADDRITYSLRVTPENPIANEIDGVSAKDIFASAKQKFGITRSVYEAGYVLPDGSMLDFSGRSQTSDFKQGADLVFRPVGGRDWMKDQRGIDHREIEWGGMPDYSEQWGAMVDFLRLGAVRVDGNSGMISMHSRAKITAAQASALKAIVVAADGAYLDLEDDAGNRASMSLESGKWGKVQGLLNRWAAGETPEYTGTTFSLRPGDFASRVEAMFSPFQRSPEARLVMARVAKDRALRVMPQLLELQAQFNDINRQRQDLETKFAEESAQLLADLEADEQQVRQERDFELKGVSQDKGSELDRERIRRDADNKLSRLRLEYERSIRELEKRKETETAKLARKDNSAQREKTRQLLRVLDGILAASPPEVRARVGGFVKMAGIATDEAALRYLEDRVAKLDKELEKYLVKQARGQLGRIFDKARPKSDAGEKAKGKLTPELHAWFKLAEEAAKLSPAVADERIQGIEQSLASDMTDAIKQELSDWLGRPVTDDAEAQTWQETRLTLFQTFGAVMYGTDAKSERNAAEITAALDAAREAYQTGRLAHIEQLAKLREKRAEDRGDGIQRVGSPYDPNKANTRKKALNKATGLKGRALDYMDTNLDASGFILDLLGDDTTTDLYETTRRNLLEAAAAKADNIDKRKADFAAMLKQVFPGKGLVDRLRGLWELQQIQENAPVGTMSQLQAMQFTLWHLDPDSREWLATNGYGDEWQAKAEQWLTSEAKAVRAWLLKQYDGQYDRLNPVFRRLRGVNLPRVEVYGGKRQIEHSKSDSTASIEADMMRGGMDAGFTKTRVSRPTGRPRMTDALQNYWQNALQVEHYIAFAETVTELKAVFGHRDFLGAVETNRGLAKKQQVLDWISNIETAGTRDAFAHSMQGKLFGRYGKAVSASALLFKLATLAKQAPAAIQSAFKVGLKEYFTSLSRILAGKGAISLGDMYRSDTVQRRLSEHDNEMLQASKGWNQRHFENEILDKAAIAPEVMMNAGWYAMGWTDARFTTISAAVAYDVAFRDGKKLGMTDDEAKAFAANQADLIVMETAQPQDVVTKSLAENMMPQALLRLVFQFMSANRQVFGLTYLAAKQGKVANAYAVAALIAAMTQTIGGIMRMMFSDDDPEELFDPQAYALGMATAPLTGMVGLGPLVEFGLNFFGVESRFSPSSAAAAKSLEDIVNGEADTKDIGRVVSMAGAALGGRGAMLGVGWNVLNQIMGLYENVTANE